MLGRMNALRCLALLIMAGLFGLVMTDLGGASAQEQVKYEHDKVKPSAVVAKTGGTKLNTLVLSQLIDQQIDERLRAENVPASPRSEDAEFLRRVSLDITGRIPTPAKAASFLDSKDPSKRAKLVDELLASSDYGRHQADIWQALLLNKDSDNRRLDTTPLVSWLQDAFNKNQPWSKTVHDIVTASGDQEVNAAVTYFLSQNTVDKMTDNATKVFLGVQLQCAQCHNHPFTDWKQTEYWGMAAFFMKVQTTNVQKAAKNGDPLIVTESATAKAGKKGKKGKLPDSAKIVPPKFLNGASPRVAGEARSPFSPIG